MEKEQPQIQLNLDPNIYTVTNVNLGHDPELFHFLLSSGNQGRQFAATPAHAKRISMLLQQQIEQYEKHFGQIKTALPKMQASAKEESTKLGF